MRRLGFRRGLLGLVLTVLVATSCAAANREKGDEVYLEATRGPYRGQVVDTQTKKPIPGVVVVAIWYYDVPALVQINEMFHDALEVLTDTQGYFVVDAPEIERRAPPRTKFPLFTIFKPGYTYFEGRFAAFEAMAEREKRASLGVVELEPMIGRPRSERLSKLPLDLTGRDVPRERIPNFLKALADERDLLRR